MKAKEAKLKEAKKLKAKNGGSGYASGDGRDPPPIRSVTKDDLFIKPSEDIRHS